MSDITGRVLGSFLVLTIVYAMLPGVTCAGSGNEWESSSPITYHLSASRVEVNGTAHSKFVYSADGTKKRIRYLTSADVALRTEADDVPAARLQLQASNGLFSHKTLQLELSDKGTLTSTDYASEGILGKVVTNVFKAVVSIASGAVPFTGAAAVRDELSPLEKLYATGYPDHWNRRQMLSKALGQVNTQIVEIELKLVEGHLNGGRDLPSALAARQKLKALKEIREDLRAEATLNDAHYKAWKATMEDDQTVRHGFLLRLTELPEDAVIANLQSGPDTSHISEVLLQRSKDLFQELEVVVAKKDPLRLPEPSTPKNGIAYTGLFYRIVRPVELSMYQLDPDVGNGTQPVLRERQIVYVVDEHSPIGFLEFSGSHWSKRGTTARFSSSGTLQKLSSSQDSNASAVADTLATLPDEYLSALKLANDVTEQRQRLRSQDSRARLEDLKREKEIAENQLALGELLDTGAVSSEISRLEKEIALLEAQIKLGETERKNDVAGDRNDLELQKQIQELRNAIQKGEIDRLKLERELDELRKEVEE